MRAASRSQSRMVGQTWGPAVARPEPGRHKGGRNQDGGPNRTVDSEIDRGPARPGVGTDGGANDEEEYVQGKTNELNVANEVAGGDEMARTSKGDVGFMLGVNTTGAREGEDRWEGGSAIRETIASIGTDDWLLRVKRGIQQSEMVCQGQVN